MSATSGRSRTVSFTELPVDIQRCIFEAFVRVAADDTESVSAARLVCRTWRNALGRHIGCPIKPASLLPESPLAAFVAATSLDLSDAAAAGAVTDAALLALPQQLSSLTSVVVPCRNLTVQGVGALAKLTSLERLTLKNDGELTAEHVAALNPLTATLTALEMPYHRKQGWGSTTQFTCMQRLTFNSISRMSGDGLDAVFAACPKLSELNMHRGELSRDVSLARSSLTRLAVLNRKVMDANVFANAAASLTGLRRLQIVSGLLSPALGTAAWQSMHMLDDLAVLCSSGCTTANLAPLLHDLPRLTRLTSLALLRFPQAPALIQPGARWASPLRRLELLNWVRLSEDGLIDICRACGATLTALNITGCAAAVTTRSSLTMHQHLTALKQLHMGHLQRQSPTPDLENMFFVLAMLPALQEWNISETVDGAKPSGAAALACTSLTSLCIPHITQAQAQVLATQPRLKTLQLHTRANGSVLTEYMEAIACMTGLTRLTLSYTEITGAHLQQVARLRQLRLLDLRNCMRITPQSISALFRLPHLRRLDLTAAGHEVVGDDMFQEPAEPDSWPPASAFAAPQPLRLLRGELMLHL